MKRGKFIHGLGAMIVLPVKGISFLSAFGVKRTAGKFTGVRPSDSGWPSADKWEMLKSEVKGNLIKIEPPLTMCRMDPSGSACTNLFKELKNPYFIGDQPGLTQTSGWPDAWTSSPSAYAVSAVNTADVVAAVNFARRNKLRLVTKGSGHSYQGTSNSADSLLVWTRKMNVIELEEQFIPVGSPSVTKPLPAVSVQSGAIWMHVYNAVTAKGARYVQGGGCGTVGLRRINF